MHDLADDLTAVLDAVGSPRAVVVGYSLGGAVAQELWRLHPERVGGLVLCSTARNFQTGPVGDLWYRSQGWIAPVARRWPTAAHRRMKRSVHAKVEDGPYADWFRSELLRSDPAVLLQIGAALGRFRSNRWITEVDVPTAVVATTKDRTVAPRRQRQLAASIPEARTYEVTGPHDSAVSSPELWVPTLRKALDDLDTRVSMAG